MTDTPSAPPAPVFTPDGQILNAPQMSPAEATAKLAEMN